VGEIADASDEWLKPQLRLRALLACVPQDRRPDLSPKDDGSGPLQPSGAEANDVTLCRVRTAFDEIAIDARELVAIGDPLGSQRPLEHGSKPLPHPCVSLCELAPAAGYENAVRAAVPDAEVAFDPFHVCQLASRAVDDVRRAEWNAKGKSKTKGGNWVKGVRWSLLKAPERQSISQLAALGEVSLANRRLLRAFLLKGQLRLLYHLDDPRQAAELLEAWLAWACRSKLKPFVKLARTIRKHRDGILAAIRLGLSNGRLEGLNSRVRLISHRSFGFHGATPLIALVYLCCGGVTITPPLR